MSNQSVFGFAKLAEQGSSPTVPTGLGFLYFKTDGFLYAKNDAGEEVQITNASGVVGGSSSSAVNELQWGGPELFPAQGSRSQELEHTGESDNALTPSFRFPNQMITDINASATVYIEVMLRPLSGTGDVDLTADLVHHDQSADTDANNTNRKIVTIAAASDNILVTFPITPTGTWANGDWGYINLTRDGDSADDTLAASIMVDWIRVTTADTGYGV